MIYRILFIIGLGSALAGQASARLGETEAQSAARYGSPSEDVRAASGKPLLPGAREAVYETGDWRIRAAFVDGTTVRIEYTKLRDAASGRMPQPNEIQAILAAEKDRYSWREEADRRKRNVARNRDEAPARAGWIRGDRATAQLQGGRLVIESRNAAEIEERLARQLRSKGAVHDPSKAPKF
jgi:hypothetical protein